MANLNIRQLTNEQHRAIRVKAAQDSKSMESYARDLILDSLATNDYELRVERGGDHEFVPWKGNATAAEAYQQFGQWLKDQDVTKLWLSIDGQIEIAWPHYEKGKINDNTL